MATMENIPTAMIWVRWKQKLQSGATVPLFVTRIGLFKGLKILGPVGSAP